MNIKKLFTKNWKVKLVSLLIAIGFWTYVSSIGVKVDELPGGLPLEIRNVKEGLVSITDIQNIDIKLVAERSVWSEIKSDSLTAYIDMAGYDEGTYEMQVNVQVDIKDVQISEIIPKRVTVRLEPEISKTIPVNVKIEGEASEGLIPGTPEVSPEEIEIIGAESVLDNILEATAVVKLNGESDDVSKVVNLNAFNADNEKINNIRFNPQSVTVNIPIIRADTSKSVGIKALTTGQPADGYWLSSITTIPSSVVITGTSEALVNTTYIQTTPIDISNISSNQTFSANLQLPTGITLIDELNEVRVNIKLSSIDTTKQINAKINYLNLDPKYRIVSINPEIVSVNLSGEKDVLNNLNSENVSLNLDLSEVKTGEYNINISKDMFEYPNEATILNYNPSAITIRTSEN